MLSASKKMQLASRSFQFFVHLFLICFSISKVASFIGEYCKNNKKSFCIKFCFVLSSAYHIHIFLFPSQLFYCTDSISTLQKKLRTGAGTLKPPWKTTNGARFSILNWRNFFVTTLRWVAQVLFITFISCQQRLTKWLLAVKLVHCACDLFHFRFLDFKNVIFCLMSHPGPLNNFTENTVDFSGIRTRFLELWTITLTICPPPVPLKMSRLFQQIVAFH